MRQESGCTIAAPARRPPPPRAVAVATATVLTPPPPLWTIARVSGTSSRLSESATPLFVLSSRRHRCSCPHPDDTAVRALAQTTPLFTFSSRRHHPSGPSSPHPEDTGRRWTARGIPAAGVARLAHRPLPNPRRWSDEDVDRIRQPRSNVHPEVGQVLRQHYSRPAFLPLKSESSSVDWMFIGKPGPGAQVHIDTVGRPSWQAQVKGKKTWQLFPSAECEHVCRPINGTMETGDIIIVDTNQWYHSTFVWPGEISITIGSEYD